MRRRLLRQRPGRSGARRHLAAGAETANIDPGQSGSAQLGQSKHRLHAQRCGYQGRPGLRPLPEHDHRRRPHSPRHRCGICLRRLRRRIPGHQSIRYLLALGGSSSQSTGLGVFSSRAAVELPARLVTCARLSPRRADSLARLRANCCFVAVAAERHLALGLPVSWFDLRLQLRPSALLRLPDFMAFDRAQPTDSDSRRSSVSRCATVRFQIIRAFPADQPLAHSRRLDFVLYVERGADEVAARGRRRSLLPGCHHPRLHHGHGVAHRRRSTSAGRDVEQGGCRHFARCTPVLDRPSCWHLARIGDCRADHLRSICVRWSCAPMPKADTARFP